MKSKCPIVTHVGEKRLFKQEDNVGQN